MTKEANTNTTMATIFTHPDFGELRTIEKDGEIWFYGKEVARALGYTNPMKAIRDHIDTEDKGVNVSFTPRRKSNFYNNQRIGLVFPYSFKQTAYG